MYDGLLEGNQPGTKPFNGYKPALGCPSMHISCDPQDYLTFATRRARACACVVHESNEHVRTYDIDDTFDTYARRARGAGWVTSHSCFSGGSRRGAGRSVDSSTNSAVCSVVWVRRPRPPACEAAYRLRLQLRALDVPTGQRCRLLQRLHVVIREAGVVATRVPVH